MDASGRDVVLLETVGVGQAEVDIIDHADTVVLVLMPGSGDSIQALKAGVMEIPDVIVVNKADHPLTDTMVREIKGVLALGPARGLAGADRPDRGGPRRGRRGARREARRAPRVHRGRGDAVRAPAAQPDERGAGDRDLPDAPRARGLVREDPRSRSCSTASSPASSTRPARRRGSSSARGARTADAALTAPFARCRAGAVRRRGGQAALTGGGLARARGRSGCPRGPLFGSLGACRAGVGAWPLSSPRRARGCPSRSCMPASRSSRWCSRAAARRAAASASATRRPRSRSRRSARRCAGRAGRRGRRRARHRLGARARARRAQRADPRDLPGRRTRPCSPTPSCRTRGRHGARR